TSPGLSAVTLIAAPLAAKFDPLQHPRGHDGKFVETGSWIKFLFAGKWLRGKVTDIDAKGTTHITTDKGGKFAVPTLDAQERIYSIPQPKASLDLPEIGKDEKGYKQIGGQGGSNKGAMYETAGVSPDLAPEPKAYTTVDDL